MMNRISISSKLVVLTMLMIFAFGCKSSKKMEAAKAEEKARIEQEQQANLRKQKEEEAARKREAEEIALRQAEAKRLANEANDIAPQTRLTDYFQAISNSGTVSAANNSITEALTLFASPETPVLIVISEYNNQKDYDRPTTIKDYLNYLKDQRKNTNAITNLKFDSRGKITEVELRKPL